MGAGAAAVCGANCWVTGAAACGTMGAPARWFRAAVSAVTAVVSSLIFCSIDMMKTPFGWTWDYSEAVLDERLNDFTQEITGLP